MTDTTPRAGVPLLAAAQAQKHVTHNEALVEFDALLCSRILDRDLSDPPASPADGDAYLVKAAGTGDWTGQDGAIAYCIDGGWRFYVPYDGLSIYVADEAAMFLYASGSWESFSNFVNLQNVPEIGINATADSTNRLAVKSNAVLFDAITAAASGSGDIQLKLNKEAAADTASFLFQTAYSGRAEIGLTGDDDFHFKVSADGAAWTDALVIDRTTGLVTVTADPTADLGIATKQYVDASGGGGGSPGGADTEVQYNNAGAFGGDSGFTYDGAGTITLSGGIALTGGGPINFEHFGDIEYIGTSIMRIRGTAPRIAYGIEFCAGAASSAGTSSIMHDASNILGQRNGTSAQARRLYESYSDASNYSRMTLDAAKTSAGVHRLMAEAAGTGTLRPIVIDGYAMSGAPTASELPDGTGGFFKDTSGGTVVVAYNDGGTIVSAVLS